MQRAVALRDRGWFAVLLNTIVQQARHQSAWREPDQRNLRTWRQFVLALLVHRSTHPLASPRPCPCSSGRERAPATHRWSPRRLASSCLLTPGRSAPELRSGRASIGKRIGI